MAQQQIQQPPAPYPQQGQQFQPQLGDEAPVAQITAPAAVAITHGQRDEYIQGREDVQHQAGNLPGGKCRCLFRWGVFCKQPLG